MPPSLRPFPRALWLVLAIAALAPGAGAALAQDAPWPMAGGDATHRASAEGPRPPLQRSWRARVGERGAVAGPVVAGGRVIVVGWDAVAAFEASDGAPVWELEREPAPAGMPAVAGDAVIYGEGPAEDDDDDDAAALIAVGLEDGSPRWRRELRSPAVAGPTVDGERVVMATRVGEVVAVEAATGRTAWRVDAPGRVETSPAIADGAVVVVAEDYDSGTVTVLALDAETGAERWRFVPEGIALGSSAAAIAGGTVVVGLGDLHVHGLRLRDGVERWAVRGRAAYGARFTPATGAGVVIGDRLGHVARMEPATGAERWLYRVPGDLLLGGPAFLEGRWVAIGDGSGALSVIDARTGRLAWAMDLGARRVEAVAADGERLYVAERGGPVTAFVHDARGRLLDEPSPTTLFPLRAVAGWAFAAAPIYVALLLLFRFVTARSARRREAPGEDPAPEGWR